MINITGDKNRTHEESNEDSGAVQMSLTTCLLISYSIVYSTNTAVPIKEISKYKYMFGWNLKFCDE